MGANYNTILIPAFDRNALLGAITGFLAEHRAVVQQVEQQTRRGVPFATKAATVVLFGAPCVSGWLPVTAWGDGLIPDSYRSWNRENSMACWLSRVVGPVIYLFSQDSGYVAGYSVFAEGEQVEALTLPWKDGVAIDDDFRPSLPPPGKKTRLGESLGEPNFDYLRFARDYRSLEEATGSLVAKFAIDVHLMDPLHMTRGHGLAVDGGSYAQVELDGWTCITWRRRREPGASADRPRD
jgi:hypothetical protein